MSVEDIEEITADPKVNHERANRYVVRARLKASQAKQKPDTSHFLPGQYTIFLKTWGCSHNNSDSEYMAGLLNSQGYSIIFNDADKNDADLWLLNSCTVKNPSEQTFINVINDAKKAGKRVVVCGCIPQAEPNKKEYEDYSVVGVHQIDRIVEVVEESLKGNQVRLIGTKRNEDKKKLGGASLDMPKIRKNAYVEILAINTGCLNQCTYCKTKHARGDLGSYPSDEIVDRIKTVLDEGVAEIWLTSEDTGAYGRDIGENLPHLLSRIVQILDEAYEKDGKEVMLRVGMTNPPYILEDLKDIAAYLNHPRVYKFLHIPVQSGSDRVLSEMRRQYTRADFCHVVDVLRELVPGITLATDIICGFPTENEDDHQDSMSILDKYKFPVLHISQFYPRPGTPAARMTQLPRSVIKQRSREVTKLFHSYEGNGSFIGKTFRVWITEETGTMSQKDDIPAGEDAYGAGGKKHDACWVGHNIYYQQVLVPKRTVPNFESLLGHVCEVTITSAGKFYLMGEIAQNKAVKLANPTSVSSGVVLQRVGRNNRQVVAKLISKKNDSRYVKFLPIILAGLVALALYRALFR